MARAIFLGSQLLDTDCLYGVKLRAMKCPKPSQTAKGGFPCGQCIACRINKKRIWAGRIVQEWLYHPQHSFFCTLTYNPEHLPKPEIINNEGHSCGSLDKKWFRQWIKNVQKIPTVGTFRYYAVGEYGDRSSRAHYHMALFPEHPSQVSAIQANWQKRGFFSYAPINHQRCGYLANYVTKKLTGGKPPLPGAEPEFRISSRNPPLGAAFVEAIIAHYKTPRGQKLIAERGDIERTFRVDGKIYPFGVWSLTKIRESLGIPLLHRERLEHPHYHEYFDTEEPEWDDEKARAIEVKYGEKAQRARKLAKPYIQI